jgi:hypothetical protein
LEETLDGRGGDETGTAGCGDKLFSLEDDGIGREGRRMEGTHANRNGTTLSTLLGGQGVRKTKVGTPVASSNGQNAQLGNDNSSADSSSHFLGGLDTKSNVSLRITNNNNRLKSRTLTSTSLLLDRLDLFPSSIPITSICQCDATYLHNLILQLRQEEIHNLVLLNRQRMKIDLFH